MINTLRRAAALWASMAADSGRGAPGIFASTDRCATQRHPVPMPLGLRSALRQRPAGRHGIAAMPAEKHVEPVVGLPEPRCAPSKPRLRPRPSPLRPRHPRQAADRTAAPAKETAAPAAAPKAAASTRQKAEQRAGRRDPQRVPLRLSKDLRRRADRRRTGAAMPGKEQVESLGGLPAGRQCGQRRRRSSGRGGAASATATAAPEQPPPAGAGAGAAPDAAARGIVRAEVGMRRRRSRALRRHSTRRRTYRAMPGGAGRRFLPACKDVLSQFAAQ